MAYRNRNLSKIIVVMRRFFRRIAPLLAVFLIFSCSDKGTGPGDSGDSTPTGTVKVVIQTSGDNVDSDGYTITVGDNEQSVDTDDVAQFVNIEEGSHEADLSGLADNCSVDGDNPRSVKVTADETTTTNFKVSCSAETQTGAIKVTTETSGDSPDSDGYTLAIADQEQSIGTNETMVIGELPSGNHDLELTDMAENCSVSAENPRSVDIAAGDTTETTFSVSCPTPTGSVKVTTESSGQDLDSDGYTISITGQQQDIEINTTVTLDGIEEGTRDAELTDVASNCTVVEGDNPRQLTVTGGETTNTTFEVSCESVSGPGPSGQERIVFHSDRTEDRQIFIMNPDGTGVTNLTPNTSLNINPVISPDGSTILFSSGRNGGFQLFTMDIDGSNVKQITDFDDPATLREPSYSPDGSRIAFNAYADGSAARDIYVIDSDGTNLKRLTDNGTTIDLNQVWSPNGDRIAFTSGRDGDAEIYTMKPDGSDVKQLTHNDYADATPAWSPDGTKIAYASSPGEYADIYTMNADGTGKTQVTDAPETDEFPSWSPDGSEIVFETLREEGYVSELYKKNADGSGSATKLTADTDLSPYGSDSDPFWSEVK